MPRRKGSKNKVNAATDFEAILAEKLSVRENLSADIASLEEKLNVVKSDLKAKKSELKAVEKELAKLEKQQSAIKAMQAEEAKKAELDELIKKLLSNGMSASEILEKLK